MHDKDTEALHAAIAALETQRATLGDTVLEVAMAPLRARLASLLRPAGLKHRLVTVLFADVVGSTAMANGMEAEDTLGLLSAVLRRMAGIVQAHQGRVLRFTGDGLKAAFGMDETREDDAERAVRAGLAMLQAGREQAKAAARLHGITDFEVRVGVHSGDVALGEGVEDDNTAMGAAVNIAARMEQHAPPGGLRISHDTWSQVRGLFELDAQPPLQVKGIEAPMQTYLVRAALERGAASVERGLQGLATPMVGRDAELQRLLQVVAQARQTRQLQALTLIGDAGLGKSRLLREGMAALQDCRLLTLRSQPDSQLRPWGLLRGLLALQCGVADTDSADVAKSKVVEGLSPWFEDRGERQAQLVGYLSGLDFADSPTVKGLDPLSVRDQALMALRVYLQALAAQGSSLPVLFVEDLHWADDSSLDLLQHLQAHAVELPLALVMTARPPLLVRRPDWVKPDVADSADAPVALMTLSPLPADQSNELLQALLQRLDDVPPKLSELIVGRAEGNPYYMEELVRRLIDDGVIDASEPQWTVRTDRLDSLRLPTTLVGLLQARLDALPANDRQAARQASVIGHVFWDDALQALDAQAPQALPALQRAAFVKARDASDFEGTTERQFDHHLLHQVTYDTLLKAERKLGHGAAARWLRPRTQSRGAEFLAMTGEHAERAGETALAIECFDTAATEATKRFANAAAVSWLRRALALLGESDPIRRFDLFHRLEAICARAGDRPAQDLVHADMAALLDRHPDDSQLARLMQCRALLAHRRGESPASEQHALRAIGLAERSGPAKTACQAHVLLSFIHDLRMDITGARNHANEGLRWACRMEAGADRDEVEVGARISSALVSIHENRFDEARIALHDSLARSRTNGWLRQEYGALGYLLEIEQALGRYDEALALITRLQTLGRTMGAPLAEALSLFRLAEVRKARCEPAAAVLLYEQCLPLFRSLHDRRMEALTLDGLGRAQGKLGAVTEALRCHSEAHCLFQDGDMDVDAIENDAYVALCQAKLGQCIEALAGVNTLLDEADGPAANLTASATIDLRWACQQVLDELGDKRAEPVLAQLHVDVQRRAAELTDAADRDRLIQVVATFRDIVAAWSAVAATRSA
jgi:class 3 adenylate cyclase/tetratricopeptide (TPR) repeat protein